MNKMAESVLNQGQCVLRHVARDIRVWIMKETSLAPKYHERTQSLVLIDSLQHLPVPRQGAEYHSPVRGGRGNSGIFLVTICTIIATVAVLAAHFFVTSVVS